MVFCFAGQLTGTAAGNRLYAQGGWLWSGGMNIGFIGAAVIIALARGPRESRWVGWKGGWSIRRDDIITGKAEQHAAIKETGTSPEVGDADTKSVS